jgi:hypothetical protein
MDAWSRSQELGRNTPKFSPLAHRVSKRYRIESKRYRFHSHGAAKMVCITHCDAPNFSLCSAQCATHIRSAKLAKTHHAVSYRVCHTVCHIHVFCLRRQVLCFFRLRCLWYASQRRRVGPRRDFKTGAPRSTHLNDEKLPDERFVLRDGYPPFSLA